MTEPPPPSQAEALINKTPQTGGQLTTIQLQSTDVIFHPPAKLPSRPRKIRKVDSFDAKSAADAEEVGACSTGKRGGGKTKVLGQRVLQVMPARSLTCEGEIEFAIRHLRSVDPMLAGLIDVYPPPTFDQFQSPFHALAKSILYQQLAFKAGASVYGRFVALCGGEDGVNPENVMALDPQHLRQIGVSGRKASYLHDLARKYQNGILSDDLILGLDDKSLFTMLTMVNGIGSWSVHMFMIFSLHRPDVLPVNDLGIRKGVQHLYGLEELPRPSHMEQLCEKWRPYRSVASWYLWRFNDAKGAANNTSLTASITSLQQHQRQEQQQSHQHFLDPNFGVMNVSLSWGQ